MTHLHERALEAAARAVYNADGPHVHHWDIQHPSRADEFRYLARAAVTAYLAAMPPPVSPELIAKLNALASRLTQMGEYEAVDLIDTVVARVIDAAPHAEAGDGWRDIETAPKDGTEILAYFDKSRFYFILSWGQSMMPDKHFAWVDDDGVPNGIPSHWRPLPAPPAAQEKK
jgi:hypothetical protein